MKLGLLFFGIFSLAAVACGSSPSPDSGTADADLTVPLCFTPSGLDQPFVTIGVNGGGATALEKLKGMSGITVNNDSLELTFLEELSTTATLDRDLPNVDVVVRFFAERDHTDFLSPTVGFEPTSGHITCAPAEGNTYACTLQNVILAPVESDPDTCASAPLSLELSTSLGLEGH